MINEERTLEDFGHTSDMLTNGSGKRVWRICEGCGMESKIIYVNYTRGQKICNSCVRKLIRGPFNIEYFNAVQESIDNGGINEFKTFEEFKYYSIDLLLESGRKVWRICGICRKERKITYQKYTNGQKICGSCIKKGKLFSEEHKKKISENSPRLSGKNHPNFGTHHSEEHKKKISDANSGENHYNYGKHRSEETKRKLSTCNKGKTQSHETKQKISIGNKGKIISEETRQRMSATAQKIPYEEWEAFATNSPYCPKFNEAVKEANREKYGRRCFLCDKPEEENITSKGKMRKLSVHHVDMNKNQGCDGHKWKLVPLCMWCHTTKIAKRMMQYIEYILADE